MSRRKDRFRRRPGGRSEPDLDSGSQAEPTPQESTAEPKTAHPTPGPCFGGAPGDFAPPGPGVAEGRPGLPESVEPAELQESPLSPEPQKPPRTGTPEPSGPRPDGLASVDAAPGATKAGPVEEVRLLAATYLDQLQRLQAEFDNYRRRVRREQEDWFRQAKVELVELLLPVLDDLRRARDHAGPDGPPDAAGLQLILRRFEDALNKAGLEEQKAEPGAAFDPEQHEALLVVPSAEQPEGAIVRVIEPGYVFQGKMVRRGKVACSSGSMPE